ncbi:tyrosine-type recombinase/integrase [Deinococcus radiodurans]|jgi:Site-specific recombinase XerD|uniref:Integrase, putative n=1 Tax=Deinococcus radiodurans (strain ATCC 13939 / DSM 20539 / JCM 16871 / CCUG 27074 / LMG 4051 / NBRC 15346 / NCIMB 9279 / VKM B-1422 / R1) TaxID=243230 RepID=Q9RX02_DEIRA|nr:site-specific integrase [Deinococcus radiodurans]AAF10092.1 integrase, putative [Deinococcus radiodurans R1 = ATCC 13939 = DSM 20539]ANC72242.1 hypothetical protein A2G07_10945 [Deinococcus radiodurans R1 = ATCC 13939 = DSM 20539]QEM72462.1 site-specific integrase [Deinococcus radiodurans]QIP28691.1 site-specific integrase [Deinococcus radiodurans]QIP32606.1 site-specific integrase [Deinococcus radiodurans]
MADGAEGRRVKRGQGEGSYTKTPAGRVRWRVMTTTPAGERRHVTGTARNMTAAREAVREALRAAERDTLPPRERVTVEQLVSAYIEHRAPSLKGRTVENYRALLRRNISPSLGQLKAQGVTPQRLRAFYDAQREAGQGDSVRRQTHNLLNAAYLLGLTDGVVTVNPAARARPVYVERGAARVKAFTPDEAARFYAAARADRWGWPLAFMLATGLRPGEALGLTWADVTMRGSAEGGTLAAVVHIERTRSVSGGRVYEDTPKTERGRRSLTVTGDAARLLLDARAQAEREAGARLRHNGREYQSTGYVFVTRAGTPYRPDNLRRPMARLCQAVGVPVLTPHKLRHTWASVQAAAGVPVEVLSAELGHAAPSFTRDTYRHVYESERASLTYDPLTPAAAPAPEPEPQGRKRVTVRARLAQAEAGSAEGEAGELPPSAAPGSKRARA